MYPLELKPTYKLNQTRLQGVRGLAERRRGNAIVHARQINPVNHVVEGGSNLEIRFFSMKPWHGKVLNEIGINVDQTRVTEDVPAFVSLGAEGGSNERPGTKYSAEVLLF